MERKITGECLCGTVRFSLRDAFSAFYLCHCKQCQQITGSAFASNIFTDPNNIEWLGGEESITTYEHLTREFSKSFCSRCGSGVPFLNKAKTSLIVPAGSLNELPSIQPMANIFSSEEAGWMKLSKEAEHFDAFPDAR